MIPLALGLVRLLAQSSPWENLGQRFSGSYLQWQVSDYLSAVGMFASFAALFLALSWLSKWQQSAATRNCPRQLFADLARAHGLGFQERRQLRSLCAELALSEPSEVFIRPDLRERVTAEVPGLGDRIYGKLDS